MSTVVTQDSTRSLIIANLVTLAMALAFKWPLSLLLLPYWIQSMVIGYFSCKRILALDRFSTEDVKMDGKVAEPSAATTKSAARFLALHYGFFHLFYAVFILSHATDLDAWDWVGVAVAGVAFAYNHRYSFQQNIAADAAGTPSLETLMLLPYLRIVPMHLTILIGGAVTGGFNAWAIIVFCLLKTGADVAMHRVEHRLLQKYANVTTSD